MAYGASPMVQDVRPAVQCPLEIARRSVHICGGASTPGGLRPYATSRKPSALVRLVTAAVITGALTPAAAEIGDLGADWVGGQTSFSDSVAAAIGPATFADPKGVAIDRSVTPNRVYVSDSFYHRVLGWSDADALTNGAPADIVIGQADFASFGCNRHVYYGLEKPLPTLSSLCDPRGMAVDGAGNLYVADEGNGRVLIFLDPFGTDQVADYVLGTGGLCDGSAWERCRMLYPEDVAVDAAGNVFVSDSGLNRVLEYDRPLVTDTLADRVLGQANFTDNVTDPDDPSLLCIPEGLSIDPRGNLYVASTYGITEFDDPLATDTIPDRHIGNRTCNLGGVESATTTCDPKGVASGAGGQLFVADAGNDRILEFDDPLTSTQPARVFGQPGFTSSSADCSYGRCDCNFGGLNASSLCTGWLSREIDGFGAWDAAAIALDGNGRLYVADTYNQRVLRYDAPLSSDAVADTVLGQATMTEARKPTFPLHEPRVAADFPQVVLVLEPDNSRILVFNGPDYLHTPVVAFGQPDIYTTGCNTGGLSATSLCNPTAATVDVYGRLWVADSGNNRVLEYDYIWAYYDDTAKAYKVRSPSRVFGQPDFTSNVCGSGATGLCDPRGIAIDAHWTAGGPVTMVDKGLYISDSGNNRIIHHENPLADATADQVYGQADFNGGACNAGGLSADSLCDPGEIAVDADSNLFAVDRGNNRVVVYADVFINGGGADRIFGQESATTAACGSGATGLCSPSSLALDRGGNLLVADTDNNRILVYDTPLTSDTTADRVFGQPDLVTTTCNTGGVSANSLCRPTGVAIHPADDVIFVADAGNQRVLRFDAPYCIDNFVLSPATRALYDVHSGPTGTGVRVRDGATVGEDRLFFSGRARLLDVDGRVRGDRPLVTLSTASGIVFQQQVPDVDTRWGAVYQTSKYLKGAVASGIDYFRIGVRDIFPFPSSYPRQAIGFGGRAVGLDLSGFTETAATFKLSFGSQCFTTELACKDTAKGRKCSAAR